MTAATRIQTTLLAAVLATLASGVYAAEGAYVGGDVGGPIYTSPINGISDKGEQGVSVDLYGGYKFTPNFAVEGGLFRLGHLNDDGDKARTHGAYLDGVAELELAPNIAVLGRLGVAQTRFTTPAGDDTSPALKMGAGVEYTLTPKLALRAEYDNYHATNAFEHKTNIGDVAVGLNYSI